MNTYHKEILQNIIAQKSSKATVEINQRYHGTSHKFYGLSVPQRREIVKNFIKLHSDLTFDEWRELVMSLNRRESYEEKNIGSTLFYTLTKYKTKASPEILDKLLDTLEGWAEIDSLCQSSFSAEELLDKWAVWRVQLLKFATDKNIAKRRASLVLLTKPVRDIENTEIRDLAFEIIKFVLPEKNILITKAVSWLLRDMVYNYPKDVEKFLVEQKQILPAIAMRETTNKLMTRKK